MLALLLAAGAVAAVHFTLVPLPVLKVWLEPARLEIVSQPEGAEVLVDGRPLPGQTPTSAEVQRDLSEHMVELRKEGFQSVRQSVRFDRSEALSVSITLAPESRPSFRPIPSRDGGAPRD